MEKAYTHMSNDNYLVEKFHAILERGKNRCVNFETVTEKVNFDLTKMNNKLFK